MRWRFLVLAFSLMSALGASGPIRLGMQEWSTLNPLLLSLDTDAEAVDLIFDRLVTLDEKGQFIPELLESWTVLKGGREVVLKLRPGLTWQDGRPIEAEDLVFTWRALRLQRVREIADTVGGVSSLDDLRAEGPLTVRIRLKRPRGSLLSDLYHFVPVPRHHYQVAAKPLEAAVNLLPVGSGPYRVNGKATAKLIRLERWEGYRGPHPGLAPSFELINVTEDKIALSDYELERIHYASVGAFRYYLIRKGSQGAGLVQAISVPMASFEAYFLNCDSSRSLLGDRLLRQVVAELAPWESLSRIRQFFPSRLASSFWPPESWAYNPIPRSLPQMERAIAMLEAAGWRRGPDGIRQDAEGRRLVLRAYELGPTSQRSPTKLLAARAAQAGIRIEVETLPAEALYEKAEAQDGDIWTFSWYLSLDPDVDSPLFTQEGFRTKSNVSAYLNPEIDRLFDLGRHTLDPEARKRIYLQISEVIYRDKPLIPIDYRQMRVLAHRRLRGVAFNRLGQSYGFWPGRRGWELRD